MNNAEIFLTLKDARTVHLLRTIIANNDLQNSSEQYTM